MRKLIAIILFILIWSSVGFAATRIAYEDFEGVTPGDIPSNDPTGSGEISKSGRPFYGSGGNGEFLGSGGNPGKHARAYIQSEYIGGSSYTQPKWSFDNKLGGTKEVYLKFDLKIDSNLGATVSTREVRDFKFVMITDNVQASASSSWKCYFQVNPSGSYSWYAWGGSEYYFANATVSNSNLKMWDHNWHTYEVYIKLGTHITTGDKNDSNNDTTVKLWEDGVLLLEDHQVPVRRGNTHYTLNSVGFIAHAFSLRAPAGPLAGNLYFDNIEVWDGMPDGGGGAIPPSDNTPPTIPTNQQATAISSSQIDLSWDLSTDNVGVTSYRIYRDGSQIASTANTTYQDIGLSPSTTYTYTVSAYDAAGNESGQSISVSATTQSPDNETTTVPTSLQATTISASQIDLSWSASTDNVGVTGYRIYRDGTQIASTANITYQDTGLSPLTTYTYNVSAYDAAGNESGQSSPTSAITNNLTLFSQLFEAEDMNLTSPMTVGSDVNASGSQYISPTSGTASTSPIPEGTLSFTVSQADTYYLWIRMMGPDSGSDALYVGIDTIWDRVYPSSSNTYEWVKVETSHNSGNYSFNLTQGNHAFQIGHGEINAQADTLFLTNDPNETPTNPDTVPPAAPIGLTYGM